MQNINNSTINAFASVISSAENSDIKSFVNSEINTINSKVRNITQSKLNEVYYSSIENVYYADIFSNYSKIKNFEFSQLHDFNSTILNCFHVNLISEENNINHIMNSLIFMSKSTAKFVRNTVIFENSKNSHYNQISTSVKIILIYIIYNIIL